MAICRSGARFDKDSYYETIVDESNEDVMVRGTKNGVPVEYSLCGGGSSDFSIAEVTVVNNAATNIEIIAPLSTQYGSIGSQNIKKDTTGTYEVIVPNNNIALLYFSTFGTEVSLSVTGSIELDDNDCLITGDGTITIS